MSELEWNGMKLRVCQQIGWHGGRLKVMDVYDDEKYGKVLDGYWNHEKVYIIGDEVVTDQAIICYLDNRYGRPVKDRYILH